MAVSEVVAPSPNLEGDVGCQCPESLQVIARAQGITCERIFRYAYELVGHDGSYAEAIFLYFTLAPVSRREYVVPSVVRAFTKLVGTVPRGIKASRPGELCVGCLRLEARQGLLPTCKRLHPDVDEERLADEAEGRGLPHLVSMPKTFSNVDRHWLALMESGTDLDPNPTWEELVRGSEEV